MRRVVKYSIGMSLVQVLLFQSALWAQDTASQIISKPICKVKMQFGIMIPMRDGVRLSTDIYMPDTSGSFPAILARTPYNNSTSRYDRWGKYYAERGYIFAIQDCRGRYDSEGAWHPHIGEELDGYDTIEWLASQPWCDGNVGMAGISYVGFVQWMAASEQPPRLKCIFTYGSPSSIFGDTWFQNGTLYLMDAITWAFGMHGRTGQNLGVHEWTNLEDHLPLISLDDFLGRDIPYWDEWLSHSTFDDYWARQSMRNRYQRINIPAVTVTGWYDDGQHGSLENYYGVMREGTDFAKANQRLIIGYWRHGGPYPQTENDYTQLGDMDFGHKALLDLQDIELRWFDHWLKGYENTITKEPRVKLFIMGDNMWRDEEEWPLARTDYTNYYFHSGGEANTLYGDGILNREKPGDEPADVYIYDPNDPVPSIRGGEGARGGISSDPVDQRENERRSDVLVYTSATLEEDMEVTGPVTIVLYAATSARDTDWCGKLVDVHPNGAAYNVCYAGSGLMSARFRKGWWEEPSAVEPGKVYRYELPLNPTGIVFKKGHRIRVEITSSDFPIFNRNLNTGLDPYTTTEMGKATQTVYHDRDRPSYIVLPVIPEKE